jgi:hypothetical protein
MDLVHFRNWGLVMSVVMNIAMFDIFITWSHLTIKTRNLIAWQYYAKNRKWRPQYIERKSQWYGWCDWYVLFIDWCCWLMLHSRGGAFVRILSTNPVHDATLSQCSPIYGLLNHLKRKHVGFSIISDLNLEHYLQPSHRLINFASAFKLTVQLSIGLYIPSNISRQQTSRDNLRASK